MEGIPPWLLPAISSIVPGTVFAVWLGTVVSGLPRRRAMIHEKKWEILFRVASLRHLATPCVDPADRASLMSVLHEAGVIFARDKKVVAELRRMLVSGISAERLVRLIEAMAKPARVPMPPDGDLLDALFMVEPSSICTDCKSDH